jgi:hypothetical protein
VHLGFQPIANGIERAIFSQPERPHFSHHLLARADLVRKRQR